MNQGIIILINTILHLRWDCASEEEEYMIHAAHDQHVTRTCDFLINELKVLDNVEEAESRIFFVSAKEAINVTNREIDSCTTPLRNKRCSEWAR